ncbi:DUF6545 domain-containing protein [Micromonospora sp. CPCC 206061]|uniref:DUF6545 domain-containing protein n=1 Tax=Micromonospora sp. CPCC 206061 TaxID=3122410 RepID=UPI002FF3EA22
MSTSVVRQCERRLAALGVNDVSDLDGLCRQIGKQQGRSIHLVAADLPIDRLCGMVLGTDTWAVIYYHQQRDHPSGALTLHQKHIIHHELAHLLLNHESTSAVGADVARVLAPRIDPGLVQQILARTSYRDGKEIEAEVTASLLTSMSATKSQPGAHPDVPAAAEPIGDLDHEDGAENLRRTLEPLWEVVARATPEVILQQWFPHPSTRLTRCLVEIHDGQLALGPYRCSHTARTARRLAVAGLAGHDIEAVVEAAVLIDAADAKTRSLRPQARHEHARPDTDPIAEKAWLVKVATAIADPAVRDLARHARQERDDARRPDHT